MPELNQVQHDASASPDRQSDIRNDPEFKWSTYGVVFASGTLGAFVVAVTFLVIDLAMGRPALWTPAVLGGALFLGESVADQPYFHPTNMLPVVFGYTLIHGVVFLGFASAASAGRLTRFNESPMTLNQGVVISGIMFVGLQIFFVALGMLVGSEIDLVRRLGFGWVALANAFAAIAMTWTIGTLSRQLRPPIEPTAR